MQNEQKRPLAGPRSEGRRFHLRVRRGLGRGGQSPLGAVERPGEARGNPPGGGRLGHPARKLASPGTLSDRPGPSNAGALAIEALL
jgi:hypothetical protein